MTLFRFGESAVTERTVQPRTDITVLVVIRIYDLPADSAVCFDVIKLLRVNYIFTEKDNISCIGRKHFPFKRFILKPVPRTGHISVFILKCTFRLACQIRLLRTVLREIHTAVLRAVVLNIGVLHVVALYTFNVVVVARPAVGRTRLSSQRSLKRFIGHFTLRV